MTWKKGQSGNPKGGARKPEIQELREALAYAKEKYNRSFLEHFVLKAYKNDAVAIALAKKILPDKIAGEGFGDNINVFRIINELRERVRADSYTPLGVDTGTGLDKGRTRQQEPDKTISE